MHFVGGAVALVSCGRAVWVIVRFLSSGTQCVASKASVFAVPFFSMALSFPAKLAARYESCLLAQPVPTKMATGAVLWGLGDAVAQSATRKDGEAVDGRRLSRAVAFGSLIHAPIAHVHYEFLEWFVQRLSVPASKQAVVKLVMEQFVYWGYFSNALYHFAMAKMEGNTTTASVDRVKERLWPTMLAQWSFWIPVQYLNFRFIPVRHQLNVVLTTSVVWTAFLSAAFPQSEEDAAVCADKAK